MNDWQKILNLIESRISRANFATWFKPTALKERDQEKNRLVVSVPSKVFENWLPENYSSIIRDALEELSLGDIQIVFQSENGVHPKVSTNQPVQAALNFDSTDYLLNPKYTFESFVVGSCNQFAHAAALKVAESPSKSYNPLFIYGGVGLGKTHLMQAVGHRIKHADRRFRLSYVSSEKFTNEVINAIRHDKTFALREKYRNVDVLMIDDIQFISGKEATQEELFHTFNTLYDAQKQIILSSDTLPRDIPSVQARLQSRFESGLIADIQMPDLETKVAILKKKAELESFDLPDNVAFFVANKIKSNIRELEGSLIRLIAFSSLRGEVPSIPMAQEVLRHILHSQEQHLSIEHIQKVVAEYFKLKVSELKSKNNSKRIAQPRQICMYLCRELTQSSLPEIGKEFGGKHHTTALHSINKVEELRAGDPDFNNLIHSLLDLFQ
ncbi:MAG: chromosomal replication initiator protein DnaA [Acidobacteriota bacterium]